jgi:outer membrane lipoprotein-sorting protein
VNRTKAENNMAGLRQAASVAVLSLLLSWLVSCPVWQLGAVAVRAEGIPLPSSDPRPRAPAPTSKDHSTPSSAQSTTPPAQSAPSNPFDFLEHLNPFKGSHPTTDVSRFDAKQQALVTRVSNYLSSVQALTGNFVQIGPDGRRSTGHLFLQKPGKVRFEYDPPNPIDIIADGSQVVIHNSQLNSHDTYSLSQTPLRFLLADRIDLFQDTNVIAVTNDDGFVTVVIEERQPLVGTSRLSMMFDPKDFKLRQWTITDVQGYDTTIAVSNLNSTKRPDPSLFRIDF